MKYTVDNGLHRGDIGGMACMNLRNANLAATLMFDGVLITIEAAAFGNTQYTVTAPRQSRIYVSMLNGAQHSLISMSLRSVIHAFNTMHICPYLSIHRHSHFCHARRMQLKTSLGSISHSEADGVPAVDTPLDGALAFGMCSETPASCLNLVQSTIPSVIVYT